MATPQPDPRLEQLVELVVQLASGELSVRLPPSPAADDIDAVIVGINMLAEELEALNKHLEGRVAERTRQLADAHRQLERLALYDPLTDLANRTLLAERGDELLMEVARRLRAVCRGTDTVARLGGDEFALVVVDASEAQVLDVADRIMAALQVPVRAGRQTCWISASIGVRFAERGQTAGVLLRDADTAMYVAKSHGRGGASVYEPAMHVAALRRLRQADELRAALSGNEFATYYQPIIELETGRATSVEALLRWRHPIDGLRTADTFIPVAEETGLIVALDGWVLDSAVAQVAAWRALRPGPAPLSVHVNVSPITFRTPGFADDVLACLERHDVHAADVLLEVTETQMMGEDPPTLQAMEALHTAGIGVAIDDFGTGCSSLGYVRRKFVDVIKIDRSLITGLDSDPDQRRIAAALLAVVDAFGLTAVAEGVQTEAEVAALRQLGCRYGQGYLWGEARPAAELAVFRPEVV
jgi:predicted signal transduction protein with EAL and GGDEF domain